MSLLDAVLEPDLTSSTVKRELRRLSVQLVQLSVGPHYEHSYLFKACSCRSLRQDRMANPCLVPDAQPFSSQDPASQSRSPE
jgi:hypothetical protein